jgi:hypothetical protein
MNSKSIWFWSSAAALLLGLIIAHHTLRVPPPAGPPLVLPGLDSRKIVTIHVRPKGQIEIRAERKGNEWTLAAPVVYSAQAVSIEQLLTLLQKLAPATTITAAELRQNPAAKDQYGFAEPQASLVLQDDHTRTQVLIGNLTAPGDQVFLQVVGIEEVYIVDATLLAFIPREANAWRDTAFARLQKLKFDRLEVKNGPRSFAVQRAAEDKPWRMVSPIDARADNSRVAELLQLLDSMQVIQFASDTPNPDLAAFGLQKPELEIALSLGTNPVLVVQFGKSPTNAPDQAFGRSLANDSVVTVPRAVLAAWTLSVNEVRDPHLVSDPTPVQAILVESGDTFKLERHTNHWIVMPQQMSADEGLVQQLLTGLARMKIAEFTKDIVTQNDLPTYGLAAPVLKYVLQAAPSSGDGITNRNIVQLEFGTNTSDRVFVRRTDEPSVYAVALKDFAGLPTRAFQMRERQLWNFSEDQVRAVSIRQLGRARTIQRKKAHDWTLAPGSQGIINDLAIEETVRPLCSLAAISWVALGKRSEKNTELEIRDTK